MSLAELQWYQFNHKNKRTLQLMVQTSQRPIVLQAAGVISITMDALMSVGGIRKYQQIWGFIR